MFEGLHSKWITFVYNFSWDDYATFLNGPLARLSFMIPLIGYAVIFNDYVTEQLTFENLTNEVRTTVFLDPEIRLRLLFFAFICLAIANVAYKLTRPHVMKIGESQREFSEYFLSQAPAHTFLHFHQEIRGYDPFTQDGKYYDDDWDLFWREAVWSSSGKNFLTKDTNLNNLPDYDRVDYEEAKKRHRSLLLSILRETYFREARERRPQLVVCLVIATLGYILFLVPSFDLTLRVIELTVFNN